jgi:hypothetical protein
MIHRLRWHSVLVRYHPVGSASSDGDAFSLIDLAKEFCAQGASYDAVRKEENDVRDRLVCLGRFGGYPDTGQLRKFHDKVDRRPGEVDMNRTLQNKAGALYHVAVPRL